MRLFAIGFTKKKAREFFRLFSDSGATALVGIRLRNRSQLAGFAKRDDLEFFLSEICDMHYQQKLLLTPTEQVPRDYQHGAVSWEQYAAEYVCLLEDRQVETVLSPADFNEAVLLCSKASPDRCHRRLAAGYLASDWGETGIVHLLQQVAASSSPVGGGRVRLRLQSRRGPEQAHGTAARDVATEAVRAPPRAPIRVAPTATKPTTRKPTSEEAR